MERDRKEDKSHPFWKPALDLDILILQVMLKFRCISKLNLGEIDFLFRFIARCLAQNVKYSQNKEQILSIRYELEVPLLTLEHIPYSHY
jgi:hypothetical protein